MADLAGWKAERAIDVHAVTATFGDLGLTLVPANQAFCFCTECCPALPEVWAWLESLPAPPAALLEALARMKEEGDPDEAATVVVSGEDAGEQEGAGG